VCSYVNVAFDLSQVLFIATANTLSTIPPALLDRMEVLTVPGYTHDEKLHIATRHLVPKQLQEHGLGSKHLHILDESIQFISEFCQSQWLSLACNTTLNSQGPNSQILSAVCQLS